MTVMEDPEGQITNRNSISSKSIAAKPAEHGPGEVGEDELMRLANECGGRYGDDGAEPYWDWSVAELRKFATAIAALAQPKRVDWQPSIDTVKRVIRALTLLGHSTPEPPEVVAIQIDQWLITLCSELGRFMDSLPRQSEADPTNWKAIEQALRNAKSAVKVLATILRKKELTGYAIADEIIEGIEQAQKLINDRTTPQPAQADTTPAAQGAGELVAEITGIDEYGPMLSWHKHWVDAGIGTKLYAKGNP